MDLRNKNVIYIGGFGGIGFATCQCLLEQRVKFLAIFDLQESKERLQELQNVSDASEVFNIKIDITNRAELDAAFAEVYKKMGRFDVVINGSGIVEEQNIERMVHVNLLGVIYANLSALPYMDKSKDGPGGLIVNISSVAGLEVFGSLAAYTATKHGVIGFTTALADPFYYERTQVAFVTICPGFTDTPLIESIQNKCVFTFAEQPPVREVLKVRQSAHLCAQRMMEAIQGAANGSIWLIMAGKLKEVTIPSYLSDN